MGGMGGIWEAWEELGGEGLDMSARRKGSEGVFHSREGSPKGEHNVVLIPYFNYFSFTFFLHFDSYCSKSLSSHDFFKRFF